MNEVAGLFSVAEDGEILIGEGILHKDGDRCGIGVFGILAGTKDVEKGMFFALFSWRVDHHDNGTARALPKQGRWAELASSDKGYSRKFRGDREPG